jgi:hypothetical protein
MQTVKVQAELELVGDSLAEDSLAEDNLAEDSLVEDSLVEDSLVAVLLGMGVDIPSSV